jgi:hypothetical protein
MKTKDKGGRPGHAPDDRSRQMVEVLSGFGIPQDKIADVIGVDGKTLRRSGEKKSAKAAIHMVSAFAARQRLVLGQVEVADKANEIVAIPKLLDLLAIEGAIVTLDAIGCQRAIA